MNKLSVLLSLTVLFSFLACHKKIDEKKELTDYLIDNTTSIWYIKDWSTFEALNQSDYANNNVLKDSKITELLRHLQASRPSLLTETKTDSSLAYTLIAPQDSLLLPQDTTQYKIEKDLTLFSYTQNEYRFYAGIQDSIILVGTDKGVLQKMLNSEKSKTKPPSIKLLEVKTNSEVVGFQENPLHTQFSEYSVLDFLPTENGFLATGVVQSNDSTGYWTNLANHQKPQPIQIANYTPSSSQSVWALAYQNIEELQKQLELQSSTSLTPQETQILEASEEIGCIQIANNKVLGLKSLNSENLLQLITVDTKKEETYRETPIYEITHSEFLPNIQQAFCTGESLKWMVLLEEYFIFTSSKEVAKEFITTHFNKHNLAEMKIFQQANKSLSSTASMVYYSLDGSLPKDIQNQTGLKIFGDKDVLDRNQFPLISLQLNADKNFNHLNFLAYQGEGQNVSTTRVVENFQLKIENGIIGSPIYFSNHITHRKDILVQDQTNTLHLYNSSNGKKYWSKQLDSPILGEIHEIDIYKNGRKQLAFTTEKGLHILDRNANDVAPFPINFKDKVTQGLAVFDYSNNSDYRFVVLQGKEILMYDKAAKIVKGFEFTKADSDLIMPAQHIRIGNKDYLLFAETNGKLNILDRRGKSRIRVAGKYDIKPQPVEVERGGFVFYTNNLEKINISTSGALQRQKLEDPFYKTTQFGVTAFIQSNNLRINQTQIELPLGLYTDPQIFRVGNQSLVSLTDIQENKVYVYNAQGELLQGFPVYGKSSASLSDANRNGKPNLVVQTDENSITQYSVE